MKKFGLFGTNIQESKSPELMAQYMPGVPYYLFDTDTVNEFITFISMHRKQLNGVNVTSPFKNIAYSMTQALTRNAMLCKNCNCLAFVNGFIIGHNTDYSAIYQVLQNSIETNENLCRKYKTQSQKLKIAIMGTGPVASTSAIAAHDFGEAFLLSRSKSAVTDVNGIPIYRYRETPYKPDILINATPIAKNGMLEDLGMLGHHRNGIPAIIDWNYKSGEKISSSTDQYIDGLTLLKIQAQESVKFWSKFW